MLKANRKEEICNMAREDAQEATCTLAEFLAVNPEETVWDYVFAIEKMLQRTHLTKWVEDTYRAALYDAVTYQERD